MHEVQNWIVVTPLQYWPGPFSNKNEWRQVIGRDGTTTTQCFPQWLRHTVSYDHWRPSKGIPAWHWQDWSMYCPWQFASCLITCHIVSSKPESYLSPQIFAMSYLCKSSSCFIPPNLFHALSLKSLTVPYPSKPLPFLILPNLWLTVSF